MVETADTHPSNETWLAAKVMGIIENTNNKTGSPTALRKKRKYLSHMSLQKIQSESCKMSLASVKQDCHRVVEPEGRGERVG